MEIIARKSYQYLALAIALLIFGVGALVYGVLFITLKPEGLVISDAIILIVFGAAALAVSVVFFILNGKNPKIIAYYDGFMFHFPDFECKSRTITDADFKQRRNKSGTLTVITKDGAHAFKNVKNVKFAYDKLAILILKSEGLLND